jgi:hypothetical protein
MANIKRINVSNLLLDISNPRFPNEVETQREAISTMLKLPRMSTQIMKLAKDIAENGLDPSENLIVYESEEEPGFYVAAEGNRRLTVLKLLANPEIAPDEKFVKQFRRLKKISKEAITFVDCHVDEDNTYERWVELKHTGQNDGISRVGWTTLEQEKYSAKHGKLSQQLQIFKFLESQKTGFEDIVKRKSDLRLTNIERVFGDSNVKKVLGLQLFNGYLYCEQPYQHFKNAVKVILETMLEKDSDGKILFTVNRIRSSLDRKSFIEELGIVASTTTLEKPWKVIDVTSASDLDITNQHSEQTDSAAHRDDEDQKHAANDSTGEGNSQRSDEEQSDDFKPKPKPTPKPDRDSLIPANVRLNFEGNKKCSRIFRELKSYLTFNDTINSVSIMLRVFIELSVASYIEKNGLRFKDQSRTPGLHDQIVMCAEHLRDISKKLTQKQVSAILAYSKSTTSAKGTLH